MAFIQNVLILFTVACCCALEVDAIESPLPALPIKYISCHWEQYRAHDCAVCWIHKKQGVLHTDCSIKIDDSDLLCEAHFFNGTDDVSCYCQHHFCNDLNLGKYGIPSTSTEAPTTTTTEASEESTAVPESPSDLPPTDSPVEEGETDPENEMPEEIPELVPELWVPETETERHFDSLILTSAAAAAPNSGFLTLSLMALMTAYFFGNFF